MIVVDMRPLFMVDNEGFKSFVILLDPKFKIPSRTVLTRRLLPELYNKERTKLNIEIKSANLKSIAMTSDIWASRSHDPYIDITCHYLTKDITMQNKLLDTLFFLEKHDNDKILQKFDYVLDSYDIDSSKVRIFMTTDNASNFVKVLKRVMMESMCPYVRSP